MTADTNATEIDIDAARLHEYVRQYRDTDDREEQRQIENRVLRETVWQVDTECSRESASLSSQELHEAYSELPDDAKHPR